VNDGATFSDQVLDVVEASDSTTAVTTATGNSAAFNVDTGDLDMRSNQTLQGDVRAETHVNVGVSAGQSAGFTTAATGNTAVGGVVSGTHTGIYTQHAGPVAIGALSHLEAPDAETGDIASSVQAIGNNQGLNASYGAAGVRVNQLNEATVASDGGGNVGYVSGMSTFTATTAANNVAAAGVGSGQRLQINQQNAAEVTQASQFTAYGNAYQSTTQATASGNNISANEQGALLDVTSNQQNVAYVRAQGENTGYQYGAGSAVAYGVGNSVSAGNIGPALVMDNTQVNEGGGVESVASYSGNQGYDASSAATAIGNAAAGFACSDCEGSVKVSNRQRNSADVGATATTSVGSARSATGVASAVGNSASYYVSRPSH